MRSVIWLLILGILSLMVPFKANAYEILAFGDSLTAGYGLQKGEDFASQLQAVLAEKNMTATVRNAGVSGDTTAGGLARIAWALEEQPKPDLVIVALGANDMLRGLPVAQTQKNLKDIIKAITDKNIPVLLAGMKSSRNLGPLYQKGFDEIYPALVDDNKNVTLYPFFLEGVAMKPTLNLDDGMHPNVKGVRVMAENIAPHVIKILDKRQ